MIKQETPVITQQLTKAALDLRTKGLSYTRIGNRLGISQTYAMRLIKKALKAIAQEEREELLAIETKRLDALQEIASRPIQAIMTRIDRLEVEYLGGNEEAAEKFAVESKELKAVIDSNLGIMQRRANLLGLDAPKRQDITTDGEPLSNGAVVFYLPDNGRDGSDTAEA